MGRLGWSADQALDTPLPYIHAALADHAENQNGLLRQLLGLPDPAASPAPGDSAEARLRRAFRWFQKQAEKNAAASPGGE